ncbi:MAG: PDZ domain-containing protein [Planctomycetes bacterium]|nr:PDZ domain-containing protein [Planctomycetota bacterium]
MLEALASGKPLQRAKLGVAVRDVDAKFGRLVDLDPPRGARITKVMPDSPAAQGGLELGDVILSLDGVAITDSAHLRARIGALSPQTTIKLEVWRDEEMQLVRIALAAK